MLAQEVKLHLTQQMIPFWKQLRDEEHGGYYGMLTYELELQKEAAKGCILNSRILWFFSNAAMLLGDDDLKKEAAHAYEFLKNYCIDKEYGGVYWSLKYDGTVEDDTKHTYNQAFAIYALSSYYDATGDQEALELAWTLYHLVEKSCRDEIGYGEAYDRFFQPAANEKLSENGVTASRTMNTMLHILEAYTELYRVTKDQKVAENLRYIMDEFSTKVYRSELRRQEVFFDDQWNSLIDLHSYGHDIESSWLIDRACEVLADQQITKQMEPITQALAMRIYERAYDGHSILNECENGVDDTNRIWWVQAEGMVGFLNAWEKQDENPIYLEAVNHIWDYVKEYMLDERSGSEWYWAVDEQGHPVEKPIVEPWKCPYHNGRMCFEVMRRMNDVAPTV